MNEGCATYTHYRIMNRLHEKGQLTDGNMVEFSYDQGVYAKAKEVWGS